MKPPPAELACRRGRHARAGRAMIAFEGLIGPIRGGNPGAGEQSVEVAHVPHVRRHLARRDCAGVRVVEIEESDRLCVDRSHTLQHASSWRPCSGERDDHSARSLPNASRSGFAGRRISTASAQGEISRRDAHTRIRRHSTPFEHGCVDPSSHPHRCHMIDPPGSPILTHVELYHVPPHVTLPEDRS